MITLANGAVIRTINLSGSGYGQLPDVPSNVHAADIRSDSGWEVRSDPALPGYFVPANAEKHFPGAFVKSLYFQRGVTYQVIFYLA